MVQKPIYRYTRMNVGSVTRVTGWYRGSGGLVAIDPEPRIDGTEFSPRDVMLTF